jgi:predicted metal-dependent peptidase
MSFEKMTPNQKIQAANIDCMRHPKFALFSGVICMGKSEVKEGVPTAYTNGKDKFYGAEFIQGLNRKQMRYLVLHENGHVAYKHCVLKTYHDAVKAYGNPICNAAMDYVVNALIEEMDPEFKFVERPATGLLIDDRFKGMSFPQVLNILVKEAKEDGRVKYVSMDDHDMSYEDMTPEEREAHGKMVDDANRQGELLQRKLAGDNKGGRDVFGNMKERHTNWRDALQDFISAICQGDENSRFAPPNKRLLASGFVMPSHFTETIGEIVVACDTSGSMHPYYGTIFGEIARICTNVKPESVRVLWWDTAVCGDQEFKPQDYENIGKLMSPKGGGGTTPTCVTEYMEEHKIKPVAIIWLSDGYLFCDDPATSVPSLWGIVENEEFVPLHGKVLRIQA